MGLVESKKLAKADTNDKAKKNELLKDAWRKIPKNGWNSKDLSQMKNEVMAYKCPKSTNIKFFNTLLIGQISAGKSSIINTMASVFNDDDVVSHKTHAGTQGESLTKQLKSYKINAKYEDSGMKPIKFQFWDTMGLEVEDNGLDIETICMILDGKVQDKANLEEDLELRPAPEMKDKMHCVMFVVHTEKFGLLDAKVLEKLTLIRNAANKRNINCLVVCTAIDLVCDHVEKDTSKVFQSENVEKMVAMVSERSGYPLNKIHPQRNYSKETNKEVHVDFLTMLLFKQILRISKDFCERLIDEDSDSDSVSDSEDF